jgi:hypothetical protein
VNPGHSQQESKVGPRPNFLISRFASIQARRVHSAQSIVLGAIRDSAKSHIYGFMALCRFLLADRPVPCMQKHFVPWRSGLGSRSRCPGPPWDGRRGWARGSAAAPRGGPQSPTSRPVAVARVQGVVGGGSRRGRGCERTNRARYAQTRSQRMILPALCFGGVIFFTQVPPPFPSGTLYVPATE